MQSTKWALLIALVFGYFLQRGSSQKRSIKNDGGGDIPQYIAKYMYLH